MYILLENLSIEVIMSMVLFPQQNSPYMVIKQSNISIYSYSQKPENNVLWIVECRGSTAVKEIS